MRRIALAIMLSPILVFEAVKYPRWMLDAARIHVAATPAMARSHERWYRRQIEHSFNAAQVIEPLELLPDPPVNHDAWPVDVVNRKVRRKRVVKRSKRRPGNVNPTPWELDQVRVLQDVR